ncbi:MAG: Crp/Fnr family transcriptional regulator [Anaerolineaceae bacterium]|nr:Crp/Fnr family transcriptional regulator [Anaerolineaceae bacterium]
MIRTIQAEDVIQRYIAEFSMADFLNDDLLAQLQLFRFPAFSNVYTEQDEQHYLYFLVRGQVQCSHYHLNGKLAVFAVSSPFTAIGDLEILTDERVHSNVIATEDTTMLGIARHAVHRYGAHDPRFLHFLIDQLRAKLYKTNSLQMNQILPVISRLAVYMLAQPANADNAIDLPSKEELASMLGATPRHLNRVLKELVESGSISAGYPRVHILDRATLQAFSH